ncbi:MAG: hypothetical protein P4L22_03060 [Candidatus Babeliales bacterium]|nr:hypothetical protein [Candidatus Babeliales bacterium]
MNLILLIMIIVSSFSYIFANIQHANELFRLGNLKLELYYEMHGHTNPDYSLFDKEDLDLPLTYLKEGLELLINSGKFYLLEYKNNYEKIHFTKLKEINQIILIYVNLLKYKDKKEILKQWEPIKNELNI